MTQYRVRPQIELRDSDDRVTVLHAPTEIVYDAHPHNISATEWDPDLVRALGLKAGRHTVGEYSTGEIGVDAYTAPDTTKLRAYLAAAGWYEEPGDPTLGSDASGRA